MPENGFTMGIKALFDAKEHMLLACGDSKAEPIFKMFYGRNDSRYPAAFLQLPSDMEVYMDKEAARKLIEEEPQI